MVPTPQQVLDVTAALLMFSLSQGFEFARLLPSDLLTPGSCRRLSVQGTQGYASATKRGLLETGFGRDGCHSCGMPRHSLQQAGACFVLHTPTPQSLRPCSVLSYDFIPWIRSVYEIQGWSCVSCCPNIVRTVSTTHWSAGSSNGKMIADHQPPLKVHRERSQGHGRGLFRWGRQQLRLFPHCQSCSKLQAKSLRGTITRPLVAHRLLLRRPQIIAIGLILGFMNSPNVPKQSSSVQTQTV